MNASLSFFKSPHELFCRGMGRAAPVFKALVDFVDTQPGHLKARCWRHLDALFRDLPDTIPAVPDPRFDPLVLHDHAALNALKDMQDKEPEFRDLHWRWVRHWINQEPMELRQFMLYSVILLVESYRSSYLRKKNTLAAQAM